MSLLYPKFSSLIIAVSCLPGLGHHNICSSPVEVGGDLAGVEVQQISTYGDCSLAVSRDGQLYGWGNSEYLQFASVTESTQVRRISIHQVEMMRAGDTSNRKGDSRIASYKYQVSSEMIRSGTKGCITVLLKAA